MNRDEYLRLLAEGFTLAFERGELEEGAARYKAALGSLASGEHAYSDHHGEYATILGKLSHHDQALDERRRALEAAEREGQGDPDSIVVALARYFLGEQLLSMGKPEQALSAIALSMDTRTSFAGPLLVVQAESLAAVGRLAEAKEAAALAVARATDGQRANVQKRLSQLLVGT